VSFLLLFVKLLTWALTIAVVGRALMSFISPRGDDPVSTILIQITEPILAPIRQVLPQTTLDFSPIIAIVVLQLMGRVVSSLG
jgi:YggT family protein